jgi:hypothetical protein
MRRLIALGLGSCLLASPIYAALKLGAQAPVFTTATLAGNPFTFSLADALSGKLSTRKAANARGFSLHEATIPSYQQILSAVGRLLGKAEAYCSEQKLAAEEIVAAKIDAFLGRDMRYAFGERQMNFAAENFLLSFSQPNFYFHATTAYGILRWKGLPLSKRDFTGRVRIRT